MKMITYDDYGDDCDDADDYNDDDDDHDEELSATRQVQLSFCHLGDKISEVIAYLPSSQEEQFAQDRYTVPRVRF